MYVESVLERKREGGRERKKKRKTEKKGSMRMRFWFHLAVDVLK